MRVKTVNDSNRVYLWFGLFGNSARNDRFDRIAVVRVIAAADRGIAAPHESYISAMVANHRLLTDRRNRCAYRCDNCRIRPSLVRSSQRIGRKWAPISQFRVTDICRCSRRTPTYRRSGAGKRRTRPCHRPVVEVATAREECIVHDSLWRSNRWPRGRRFGRSHLKKYIYVTKIIGFDVQTKTISLSIVDILLTRFLMIF